jgi:hypothetical protein
MLAEIKSEYWLLNTFRQDNISFMAETEAIILRKPIFNSKIEISENALITCDAEIHRFPKMSNFMYTIAKMMNTKLCRALIARIKPYGQVYSHYDGGLYYKTRDRFHLVLDCDIGNSMTCGDETVDMHKGELWWFNNSLMHESFNKSDIWRIHLIFDLESNDFKKGLR